MMSKDICSNESVVQHIVDMLDEVDISDCKNWSEHWVEEVSYSNWALAEIAKRIMDHPKSLADDTIWTFALDMELNESACPNPKQRRMFEIASSTALELLDNI